MAEIKVGVINASEILIKDQKEKVQAVVAALQTQVQREFSAAWGKSATVRPVDNDDKQHCPMLENYQRWWWLVLLDTPDVAGYYGYHDFTNDGMPLGKVFVQTALENGREWSVTASHELLEMLTDPWLNLSVFKKNQVDETRGMFYAYDICDPCQEKSYVISGVEVSDFVYPAWFEPFPHPKNTQFAHKSPEGKEFQLWPGGYINVFDVPLGTGWHQLAEPLPPDKRPVSGKLPAYELPLGVGSRRERRRRKMSGHEKQSSNAVKVPLIP